MSEELNKHFDIKTFNFIHSLCKKENSVVKLKKKRKTKYADFRPNFINGKTHLITINIDENSSLVLLSILHEIAHAITWNRYKRKAKPHGAEWKENYKQLLQYAIHQHFFPIELQAALLRFSENIKSSHHYNTELVRALATENTTLLTDLEEGQEFVFRDVRYIKGGKIRTRYKCKQKNTKKEYLFSPNASVMLCHNS